MAEVTNVKKEYAKKQYELEQTLIDANKAKSDAEAIKEHQQKLMQEKVQKLYQSKKQDLINQYENKKMALNGVLLGSLLYGILCTVFTAINSKLFALDFKNFFEFIWIFIVFTVKSVGELAKWIATVADIIPQPIGLIVYWLIFLAIILLVGGGILAILGFVVFKIYVIYADYADNISLAIALISLAVVVFFANPIATVIPINLCLLFILIQAIYIGVRCYLY